MSFKVDGTWLCNWTDGYVIMLNLPNLSNMSACMKNVENKPSIGYCIFVHALCIIVANYVHVVHIQTSHALLEVWAFLLLEENN